MGCTRTGPGQRAAIMCTERRGSFVAGPGTECPVRDGAHSSEVEVGSNEFTNGADREVYDGAVHGTGGGGRVRGRAAYLTEVGSVWCGR